MAKTELVPKQADQLPALPSFMEVDTGAGTEEMAQFLRPPFLKIVKDQSKALRKEGWMPGTVLINPGGIGNQIVMDEGKSFVIIPLMFYVEYCTLNPYKLKDSLPMVRERTLDPHSELAAKCKDPNRWKEPCPESPAGDPLQLSNAEMLNFLVTLDDHELAGQPLLITLHSGEHKVGRRLSALVQASKFPIFGCRFKVTTSVHEYSGDNSDWGFDFEWASPPCVEDEGLYAKMKESHLAIKTQHAAGKVRTEYEDYQPVNPASQERKGEQPEY